MGRSHREVARSLGISSDAVGTTVLRARAAGLDWAQVQALADDALEARLYGRPEAAGTRHRPQPDCAYLHAERRKPGVTLELLPLEHLEQHPTATAIPGSAISTDAGSSAAACRCGTSTALGRSPSSITPGKKPRIIDPTHGEVIEVELFVAVLGASNYAYAEATRTQQVPDWIASHQRAFAFFRGVPGAVVPD